LLEREDGTYRKKILLRPRLQMQCLLPKSLEIVK
jgi:hypothetical protein